MADADLLIYAQVALTLPEFRATVKTLERNLVNSPPPELVSAAEKLRRDLDRREHDLASGRG